MGNLFREGGLKQLQNADGLRAEGGAKIGRMRARKKKRARARRNSIAPYTTNEPVETETARMRCFKSDQK